MAERVEVRDKALALRARFEAIGAQVVDPPILQPAETLLDLYGEDIRGRAYVTHDALRGELMLRPDFTVPVVQMHMESGAEPARYTYAGEVFRRQEEDPARASEFQQVGFEIFDRTAPEAAETEVFCAIADALSGLPVAAQTGDIGLLTAAVQGIETSDARKAALMRHIWRPARFRRLLDRFAGRNPRRELALDDPEMPEIGKRSRAEVDARRAILAEDAAEAPIDISALESLLAIEDPLPAALVRLRLLSRALPAIAPACDRLEARMAAMITRGVKVDKLSFAASFGRTHMEYYDGFVFAFSAEGRSDLPPLASGGRYDALTRRLGQGAEIPAVGGVLRPGPMLALEGGA